MERDLLPLVRLKFLEHKALCAKNGITIQMVSGYRSIDEQNKLYAQGRTSPGSIVTKARGGQSFHNWRVAYDVCPVVNGKLAWEETKLFNKIGQLGQSIGLEWGGSWDSFVDLPHFQIIFNYTFDDFINKRVDYSKWEFVDPLKPKYKFSVAFGWSYTPSEAVKALQSILKWEKVLPANFPIDGKFLEQTARGLKTWQISHGITDFQLESDPKKIRAGLKTIIKLNELYSK